MQHEVIKHSSAIQISNRITLLQRRAWNVLLAHAYDHLLTANRHTIHVSHLTDWLGITTRNDAHLKEMLRGLAETTVEWNVLGKDGHQTWGVAALLADIEIREGVVHYSYGGILREKLYNPTVYARIKLSIQNKFNSKHSLALYELLIDHLRIGQTRWVDLDAFRKLMGLEAHEYPEYKVLNRDVIKASISEINKLGDINASVEYKRQSRRVVAVKFYCQPKESLKQAMPAPLTGEQEDAGKPAERTVASMMVQDAFDHFWDGLTPIERESLRRRAEKAVDGRGRLTPRTREAMVVAEMRQIWQAETGEGSGRAAA